MNAVEVLNLTKEYPKFKIDDVSFTLPSGCIMGLIGKNGAGKSTLIKLILDIIKKDGGKVKVLGAENGGFNREDVGVCFDEPSIPECLTVKQTGNVMSNIYKNWDKSEYERLTEKFDLPKDKQFKDFSRGMKKKLEMAVAMSHGSKLLILDEATSGLDPVARDDVITMLFDFTREEGHSVLISSHIVSDLEKVCDYIAFMHDGKMILCEEKDKICSKYMTLHLSNEELDNLPKQAVIYKKSNKYGGEAIVRRDAVTGDIKGNIVNLEELFVFTVKGEDEK